MNILFSPAPCFNYMAHKKYFNYIEALLLSGKDPSTWFSMIGIQESHDGDSFISSPFISLLHCYCNRLGEEGGLAASRNKSACHHLRGFGRISSADWREE